MSVCVEQAIQEPAQEVGVHVGLQALGEGGQPPEVDGYGGVLAVYLVPPALRNEQGITCLRAKTCLCLM